MFALNAQLPLAYLKKKQSLTLGNLSKTATLYVVIENEKHPDDAALISAVKNYWKIGPVKYMSGLEFSEKYKDNTLDPTKLYLFNNFTRTYAPNKKIISVATYYGYYLTNDPKKLINSQADRHAPPYLYFSSNSLYDQKDQPMSGYYSLMIKNFNHDVNYCQFTDNFLSRKRNKRKKGVVFFKEEGLSDKTLLLVKEQTVKQEKKKKKQRRQKMNASKKNAKFVTDIYTKKKAPVIVFSEDIEHALKISDPNILLFNGGTVYFAKDGSVYATSKGKSSHNALLTYKIFAYSACALSVILLFQHIQ